MKRQSVVAQPQPQPQSQPQPQPQPTVPLQHGHIRTIRRYHRPQHRPQHRLCPSRNVSVSADEFAREIARQVQSKWHSACLAVLSVLAVLSLGSALYLATRTDEMYPSVFNIRHALRERRTGQFVFDTRFREDESEDPEARALRKAIHRRQLQLILPPFDAEENKGGRVGRESRIEGAWKYIRQPVRTLLPSKRFFDSMRTLLNNFQIEHNSFREDTSVRIMYAAHNDDIKGVPFGANRMLPSSLLRCYALILCAAEGVSFRNLPDMRTAESPLAESDIRYTNAVAYENSDAQQPLHAIFDYALRLRQETRIRPFALDGDSSDSSENNDMLFGATGNGRAGTERARIELKTLPLDTQVADVAAEEQKDARGDASESSEKRSAVQNVSLKRVLLVVLGNMALDDCVISLASIRNAQRAVQYYRAHSATQSVTMLFSGGKPRSGPVSEAVMMALVALHEGVPRQFVLLETKSRSTRENAEFSRRLLASVRDMPLFDEVHLLAKPAHIVWAMPMFAMPGPFSRIRAMPSHTSDDDVMEQMRDYLNFVDPNNDMVQGRLEDIRRGIKGID